MSEDIVTLEFIKWKEQDFKDRGVEPWIAQSLLDELRYKYESQKMKSDMRSNTAQCGQSGAGVRPFWKEVM